MKNYSSLLFILFFYVGISVRSQKPENPKSLVLEKTHWMIECSEMNTVLTEFQKICDENHYTSLVKGLKDGSYEGISPADDYGYQHKVIFEMKNGKMISIDYDEIHLDGRDKQHDEEYCKRMLVSGTTPAIAYPKYETEMIATQDFNRVDAVSGATYSLYRFKLAILYAILISEQL